jgi:hypothetical protein
MAKATEDTRATSTAAANRGEVTPAAGTTMIA